MEEDREGLVHELVDRLHCVELILDTIVANHDAYSFDKEVQDAVDRAADAIAAAYQIAARKLWTK